MKKIMVTGGRGFIGSHLVKLLCTSKDSTIINVDGETYAARPPLYDMKPRNLINEKLDIRDQLSVRRAIEKHKPDHIIHLAAESFVCRSIAGPKDFIQTNIVGTWNLLEEFKELWKSEKGHRFVHISTDEVFGSLGKGGRFTERSTIAPTSPYASSKASSDLLAQSYHRTYGLDVIIGNCTNNFGPNQHPEKLVPKAIHCLFRSQPIEIFGTGKNIRDWIYVEDHCHAIIKLLQQGQPGEKYCIGGETELTNLEMVEALFQVTRKVFPKSTHAFKLQFTNNRPTDDQRYAVDCSKLKKLGWKPNKQDFEENLLHTVMWYWRRMVAASSPRGLKEE